MSDIIQRWAVVCFFIAALAMVVRVGDEPAPDRLDLVAAGACNPGSGTTTTQSTTSSSSTTTTAGGSTTTTTGGSTTTRAASTTRAATTTAGSTLPGGVTLPIGGTTSTTGSTTTTSGGSTTSRAASTTAGSTLPGGVTVPFPRAAPRNAAVAAAGECDSNVNAKYANGRFSGKVTSKSAKCERGRKVEIEKGNHVVGVKETNRRGKFKFTYPKKQAKGKTFEVHVIKERKGDVRCGAAKDTVRP